MSLVDAAMQRRAEEQVRDVLQEPTQIGRRAVGLPTERPCPGCGKRTRDREGRCSACRKAVTGFASLGAFTVPQLKALSARVRDELVRRRDEATAALEDAT